MKRLLRDMLHRWRDQRRRWALRRLGDKLSERPRVLVALDSGIGNAIVATPMVQALRMLWPGAKIDLLTPHTDLFDRWPLIRRIHAAPDDLPAGGYDHVFLPYDSQLEPPASWSAHVHRVRPPRGGGPFVEPEADTDLALARRLGYRGPRPPLYVGWADPEPDPWTSGDVPRVVVAPCGRDLPRWRGKRWPHWAALIGLLLERSDALVVVVGGPDEADERTLLPFGDRVRDGIGAWPLAQTAGVIRGADLVIGNDCGLTHIADALGVPHIVLFGPTDELKNGPLHCGRPMTAEAACRPSQRWHGVETCPDCDCIGTIGPELVLDEALEMLQGKVRPATPAAGP